MQKDDTRKTFNCFRAVTEILLDITKDEEEYARLYKAVREEKYYENGGTGRLSEPLKEDIEKSRKEEQEHLLGLLHYNSPN